MKFVFFLAVAYLVYHTYFDAGSGSQSTVSARDLEPRCDVVIFTTASCPYCKKAKNLLITKGAKWCEKNIERSSQNRDLYKSLGGRGVPFAVVGTEIIKGFREQRYIQALSQIEPAY